MAAVGCSSKVRFHCCFGQGLDVYDKRLDAFFTSRRLMIFRYWCCNVRPGVTAYCILVFFFSFTFLVIVSPYSRQYTTYYARHYVPQSYNSPTLVSVFRLLITECILYSLFSILSICLVHSDDSSTHETPAWPPKHRPANGPTAVFSSVSCTTALF